MEQIDGCSVLIVEDEFFIAADIADTLAEAGVETVGPAGSLAEAFDLITRSPRIDAAVLDVNLRREKVYPILDLLRRRDVPCLLLTGDGAARSDPLLAGLAVLTKPMAAGAVLEELRLVLARHG